MFKVCLGSEQGRGQRQLTLVLPGSEVTSIVAVKGLQGRDDHGAAGLLAMLRPPKDFRKAWRSRNIV